MALPLLREIIVEQITPTKIVEYLNAKSLQQGPLVMNLLGLDRLQYKALKMFEEAIGRDMLKYKFPYGLYFLSDIKDYRGKLIIISDKSHLPEFFRKKDKKPNVKESQLLAKIELKKLKISTAPSRENLKKIDNGATVYKELYINSQEGNFLEYIHEKLMKKVR